MKTFLLLREFIKKEKVSFFLKELKESEKFSSEELRTHQYNKLIELLKHLKDHHPYFSNYLKEKPGLLEKELEKDPYKILQELPVTNKIFIKNHFKEWLNKNTDYSKIALEKTSGSTGTPFEFYHSKDCLALKQACKSRLLNWHDTKRGKRQFCYLGGISSSSKINKIKIFLNSRLVLNRRDIDSTKINNQNVGKEINKINKHKPVSIYGYPSVIYDMANFSLKNNIPIKNKKLKLVIFSGETHTQQMKEFVYKVFKSFPVDEYCTTEGFIAGSCQYNKLHLNEDVLIGEVIDEKGLIRNYGRGELLVTFFNSFDFPFIRYNIGDIVEISSEPCQCGRSFKTLTSVLGRKTSFVFNGEKKIRSITGPLYYFMKSKDFKWIDQYQIIQNERSSLLIKLVVTKKDYDFKNFEQHVRTFYDKLKVDFQYVNEIPKDPSGKIRTIINNVEEQ